MSYVLGFDFDGVIHRYGQGDQGATIYDIPTPGAHEALQRYMTAFDVQIVSARAARPEGVEAIQAWLVQHALPLLPCSDRKPTGELLVMLDDRAWQFDGQFPTVDELLTFQPWWKRA